MNMNYYIWEYTTPLGEIEALIAITDTGKVLGIPNDENNSDYQQYLAWCAEGNTAEPWQPEEPVIEDAI